MSSEAEKNKALVRRFLEAHAKGDLGGMEEMLAPDFVDHNLIPGEAPGREGYLQSTAEYHAAYSDNRYVIEKQLAEGDKVVTTFAASATHDRGEWMGLVPTGKQFEALLVLIHRIVGGKIAEEWSQGSGLAELTQQRLEQEKLERERVEQELRVARGIQQASLPKEVPTLEDWQITPFYQPAREVGGDFYDLFELEDGVEAGYEHVGGDAGYQRLVDLSQYLTRRGGVQGPGGELQHAAGCGHYQCCRHTLTCCVPHDHS